MVLKKMFQLTEAEFQQIKYELEVLISSCSDPKKEVILTTEIIDLLLDVYSKFLKIKK